MNRLTLAIVAALLGTGCMHRDPQPWGPGSGMGTGWGYGAMGMMGGGPGMRGMQGPGMLWGLERLDLSAEQRERIARIQDEVRAQHEALMTRMHDHEGHWLRRGPAWDAPQERRSYDELADMRRQMFEMHLQTRQRILDVLTPPQREQLGRAWGRP